TGATGIAEAAARLAAAGGPLVLAKTVVGGVTVAAAACA
ncbi:cobalamin biosynthesis protein, partial [Nocardia farcinica]|nr:cobalamin biosynthesis protein [Nocardia farcinica]